MGNEARLDDEQFALVKQCAAAVIGPEAMADDDAVAVAVGSLAGALKAAKTSIDGGKFKLGLYRKALVGHITRPALMFAADRALRECEWMPTPAEIIRLAEPYTRPELIARSKARDLVNARKDRRVRAELDELRAFSIPEADLGNLRPGLIAVAVDHRILMWTLDEVVVYNTTENSLRDARERQAFTASLRRASYE